eukprot:8663576-Pyramimonas_sp.AAC.1
MDGLAQCFDHANVRKDAVHIAGTDVPAKKCALFLLGKEAGVLRALALTRALRDESGQYRKFSATALEGCETIIYIGADRNPRQIRKEVHTKKLMQILQ